MQLINGKALAEKIKNEIATEVREIGGERPNLAIILVGERDDSRLYVGLKEKQAKTVGIDTHTYICSAAAGQEELEQIISYLNNDPLIDAILLQLPLPEGFDEDRAVAMIDKNKEVDGFHPETLKKYFSGEPVMAEPVVPTVIRELLKSINFSSINKKAVVVINSELFGKVIKTELERLGLAVEIVSFPDEMIAEKTKQADLLVTAVGKPEYLTVEMIKQDAVIIDVGISKLIGGIIVGDVDSESVKDKASYLTPVPGGVGPMTIAIALRNTLKLKKARSL